MQISSRFTIAVHILICIETFKNDYKVTSDFLASSVNANPVVIRRLLQQLKKADIVNVIRGSGGTEITKPLNTITLLDIYHAVECIEKASCFIFTKTQTRSALSEKIFILFWTADCKKFRKQWNWS